MFNDFGSYFSIDIRTIAKSFFPPHIPAPLCEDDIPFPLLSYFPPFQFNRNRAYFSIGLTFQ